MKGKVCRNCFYSRKIGTEVLPKPSPHPVLAMCASCLAAVWTEPPLIVTEHEGKRVHGGMICPDCNKPFRDHPLCETYPNSGIRRLCGGEFIKL